MRKPIVVLSSGALVGAALAVVAFYSSCGTTGGGNDPVAATSQFVSQSCAPAGPFGGGSCLSLQTPNAVPADGATVSGFRARLVDGSGAPVSGVQICFAFENPLVATIVEPTNACGLTDGDGRISGQFRDGVNTGSFALVATPQAGFALQIRRTISFVAPDQQPSGGGGCTLGGDCPSGECTSNPSVCPAGPCCLNGVGDDCSDPNSCAQGLLCTNGTCREAPTPLPTGVSTPLPTPTPAGVDGPCITSANCQTGLFCGIGDGAGTAGFCHAKQGTGGTCTLGTECITNTCTGGGQCT
jgi:hypothetical protein